MRTTSLSQNYESALIKSFNKKVARRKYSKVGYLRKKINEAKKKSDYYFSLYNKWSIQYNWWMHCQWLEEHNNLLRKLQIAEGEFVAHKLMK